MKRLILIFALLLNIACVAQEVKPVTLTVSGTGNTIEEAKTNALRSAIEQAFGAFISSKTEILNDNLVIDEIVSLSNGNIQKYDVISQVEIPNTGFGITLSATVSISKLTAFAESKGVVVEFKGGMFAQNIKIQKLNEESELVAIKNLCQTSFELLLNSIDFSLKNTEPSLIGEQTYDYKYDLKNGLYVNEYNADSYKIGFFVQVKSNNNLKLFYENFSKTIAALSMHSSEVSNYESLNKEVVQLTILDQKYYLRNVNSANALNTFFMKMNLIPKFFEINSNVENYNYLLVNRNEIEADSEKYNFLNTYGQLIEREQNKDYFEPSRIIAHSLNLFPFFNDLFSTYQDVIAKKKSITYTGLQTFVNRQQKVD